MDANVGNSYEVDTNVDQSNVKDLIIIVGKGQKLRNSVKQLLQGFSPPMHSYTMSGNKGRIVIPNEQLVDYIKIHRGVYNEQDED